MILRHRAARSLSLLRRDVAHRANERRQFRAIPFQVDALCRGWATGHGHARTAFSGWTDRAWHETTAAVGADVEQHHLHALGAERTLETADAGIGRVGWQILVTGTRSSAGVAASAVSIGDGYGRQPPVIAGEPAGLVRFVGWKNLGKAHHDGWCADPREAAQFHVRAAHGPPSQLDPWWHARSRRDRACATERHADSEYDAPGPRPTDAVSG